MAKDLLKQTPEQAYSREELREMLASRESGGIIFTTVQKFSLLDDEDEHPLLCERSNVVVISDEAHRSQYGLKARLKQIKNKDTGAQWQAFKRQLITIAKFHPGNRARFGRLEPVRIAE